MRIFLSYGHDKYTLLAARLQHDIKAYGHDVWFDVERLKPGGDWERYIEDGFDWSAAVPGEGRFLLLLTPHSVRRPDGYCLNELARALDRNLPIIPVMLSTVEPPLSICRMQWLDMRNCFPPDEHEVQYAKHVEQLIKALIEKQVPFEGVQQRLMNYLNPISYDDDLIKHLFGFTGRDWVMGEVDRWLASSRRVLWITGEAGVGKSALAAWLCDKRPEISAYHFCRFGNSDRVDARKALLSLAYQLSTQHPVYRDRLNASPLDKTAIEMNVRAVFDRLFVNPLTGAMPIADRPQVLLIDALDEATSSGRNELASLIGAEFDRLPSRFRLIVTSRPHEQEVNFALQALDPWKLDAGRAENLQDIQQYLYRELRPFSGGGAPPAEIVNAIVERSEGLFLYVSWVRQELQDGRLSLGRIEGFPRGLGGVYADFFQRYFPNLHEYESDCRPALEAICAAREPLERRDLAGLLGWPEYKMRSLATRLGSLFPVLDGRVRPFHQSVGDWLTDSKRSGAYWIDVSAQEQRLADFAWLEYKNGVKTMGRYCITFAPFHLAACHRKTELRALLLDCEWVKAKLRTGGVSALLADYDLALETLSQKVGSEEAEQPAVAPFGFSPQKTAPAANQKAQDAVIDDSETNALRLIQGAIRLSSHVIRRDPEQLVSQMVGRLLPHQNMPAIGKFVKQTADRARAPWLRSTQPALHPPGTGLLRILTGHSYGVSAVAITPDGQRAVSASSDGTLRVWDVASGHELRTLTGHSLAVTAVALTPDGQRAVSASHDKTLKVWDLASGRELRTLTGHSLAVTAVALTPDGQRAVSASHDKMLKVWDLTSGRELLCTLTRHSDSVNAVVVTPDGRRVVSASDDRTLKMWDVASGRELRTLTGHSYGVRAVAVTADGQLAVSGSFDWTMKVWDLAGGVELCTLTGHSRAVNAVAVTPDGQRAVSASDDQTLKVWDVASGHELRTLTGHSLAVTAVALTPDGQRAVSASNDGTLRVWDVATGGEPRTLAGHSREVTGVAMTPDGQRAVSASADQTLKVWDVASGHELRTLAGHSGAVTAVAITADGQRAVSASFDKTLKVWDVASGREMRTLTGHSYAVSAVAVTPDGQRAVSASHDKTLKVWDLARGRELCTLAGHSGLVTAVATTPDGQRAVSASHDKTLKVWDLARARELHTITGHSDAVTGVAVSAYGRRAVSASADQTLKVWNLESGRVLRTLAGHSGAVTAVAMTPDGQWAISAGRDNTVKIWKLETGELFATFTCDSAANCCAFSNALELIVVGDVGGHLQFLHLEEPKPGN